MLLKFFICSVALIGVVSGALIRANPVVQTNNGAVQGKEHLSIGATRPFYSFRGIPYAEPPINERRFEPPVPVSNWAGVRDATEEGSRCIQGAAPVSGQEDCLHVNIYTPIDPSQACTPLPVLVWIFGGGFEGGDNSYELYGPDHLLDRGIVVATINYRLGLLGFLSTADTVAPGNNGLRDQNLAMRWIKDNIGSFCGDPDQITLGGQSAGSASVGYHIESPQSQGLFNRAIMSSGTPLSLWAYCRRGPQVALEIARNLTIDTSSSLSIVTGLKAVPIEMLQTVAAAMITGVFIGNNPREGFAVGPVAEPDHPDAFFTGRSHEILKNGQFNKVPLLIGYNSLEGTYAFDLAFRLFLVQFDLDNTKLLPIDMNVASGQAATAARELKNFYFGWIPISLANIELMTFLSDDQFVKSIREFGRLVEPHAPVYFYRFAYEGGLWGIHNRTLPGVTHSEELGYYWVSPHAPIREHDLTVRDRWTTLLVNFIKTANPTPVSDPALQNTIWTTLSSALNYLDVGEHLAVTQQPQRTNMQFWDDLYAKYGNPPYGTY